MTDLPKPVEAESAAHGRKILALLDDLQAGISRLEQNVSSFEFRIGRLDLRPGDVLVVKCSGVLSTEMAGRVARIMRERLPTTPIIIIDRQIDLAVLTKEEIEARADGSASTQQKNAA